MSQIVDKKELDDKMKYQMISEIIDEYKDREGSLIQVLHGAQKVYGYLPDQGATVHIRRYGYSILRSIRSSFLSTRIFSLNPVDNTLSVSVLVARCYVRGGEKKHCKVKRIITNRTGSNDIGFKIYF